MTAAVICVGAVFLGSRCVAPAANMARRIRSSSCTERPMEGTAALIRPVVCSASLPIVSKREVKDRNRTC